MLGYMKQIADIFNLKLNEPFEIISIWLTGRLYKFTEIGLISLKDDYSIDHRDDIALRMLLTGEVSPKKVDYSKSKAISFSDSSLSR